MSTRTNPFGRDTVPTKSFLLAIVLATATMGMSLSVTDLRLTSTARAGSDVARSVVTMHPSLAMDPIAEVDRSPHCVNSHRPIRSRHGANKNILVGNSARYRQRTSGLEASLLFFYFIHYVNRVNRVG